MIRADRLDLVRTMADLADDWQMTLPMFRKKRIHQAEDFPATITSAQVKPKLWDGEQTYAYRAGRDVPGIGPAGPSDLLDQYEVAELLRIDVRSWRKYTQQLYAPGNAASLPEVPRSVDVRDVPHWPRGEIQDWDTERTGGGAGGRPHGSVSPLPRGEIRSRAAALLPADPRMTAGELADALGIHPETAREALADVRAEVIARHLRELGEQQAGLVGERTGFPEWMVERLMPKARERAGQLTGPEPSAKDAEPA